MLKRHNVSALLIALLLLSVVAGLLFAKKATTHASVDDLTKRIESNLIEVLANTEGEATRILQNLQQGDTSLRSEDYFLVLRNDEIVGWSDNRFLPSPRLLTDNVQLKFIKTGAGEFLVRRWDVDAERVLVALIPLRIHFKITNSYLSPSWNVEVFNTTDVLVLEPSAPQGYAVSIQGDVVFKFLPISDSEQSTERWQVLSGIAFFIAFLLLSITLYKPLRVLSSTYPGVGFIVLMAMTIAIRVLMIVTEFPARFVTGPLFDPKNFASSELNPSMGDLVLNSLVVLILCLYLHQHYYRFTVVKFFLSNRMLNWVFSAFCVVCVLFAILFPFVVMQTIYNNSEISFSISKSLHVDTLRILAVITLVCTWISSFLFAHVFIRLLVHDKKTWRIIVSYGVGAVVFILLNKQSGQLYFSSFALGTAFLVCVVSLELYNSLLKFRYATFAYFFCAVLVMAVNGTIAIQHFDQQRSVKNQLRFANNFLVERDYFGEYLLSEARNRIANDVFIQSRLASPFLGKDIIRQKINQVLLSGYFNRYNVTVFLYDGSGKPLDDENAITFPDLMRSYDKDSFLTGYDGVYYVNPEDELSRKYVVLVSEFRNGVPVGNVAIELSLKRIIPESVYPELLVDDRFQTIDHQQELSYAIVVDHQVLYSAGDFNYDAFVRQGLGDSRMYSEGIYREDHLHVAVEDVNARVAIVSSPATPVIFKLADFSSQVLLGMVVILIFLLGQVILHYSRSENLFFSARIQLYLNLSFFVPLLAVSIITIGLITESSKQQLNADFLDRAIQFGQRVSLILEEEGDQSSFENEFTNLTQFAHLDANVFYPDGKLMSTSQPLIFENELLAPYIKPLALRRVRTGDKAFILTEQVGNLQFNVAYATLFSPETGSYTGILAIPFFQSASSIEDMQITVLANILSIFTLIFILLLAISFLVTKWLTAPLQMITKTIGRVSLTRANTPLQWKSDDEIGMMVREYNHMLIKLKDSTYELEQNQRERAWREIAQQVAHEIKNPLTPMKLTLQQLERTIHKEDHHSDKLNKAVASLLAQVNSLDDIASSFSSFAKMPEPVITQVELVSLLTKIINLHAQEGTIRLTTTFTEATILADEQLLGRIFSNIILNGLQAVRQDVSPEIQISLEKQEDFYCISIADNGRGIEPMLADKVFLPHFTTKKSGSGLGLAIAKQGIEQLGGKIYFETSTNGTIFRIELRGE